MSEQGVVKFYSKEKAFGFFSRANAPDVFFHRVDLRESGLDSLDEGQKVSFEVVPGKEGKPKATKITIGLP